MKIIAFYLPQFHCIPENDKWWGKGFTEWTNTKSAKPIFKDHYQPREPYNDNYYNILNPGVMKQQADIAKEYGIYGFCYYHYWFNGKQLLEKPINLMLKTQEPDFPFCLSWANEPWTRIWYAGREKEILINQEYGNKADWKRHFDYLINAFKDKRYIKINNKPVFLIYRFQSIPCYKEMIEYWDKLSKENGFNGIYIINTLTAFKNNIGKNKCDAYLEFEPGYTILHHLPPIYNLMRKSKRFLIKTCEKLKMKKPIVLDINNYDVIWRSILSRNHTNKDKVYLGAFVDWDNTARKKNYAMIVKGASPEKFEKYLSIQIKRSKKLNNDYLFINAWNEWAEANYLEPDKRYGFKYLEAVRNALKNNGEINE